MLIFKCTEETKRIIVQGFSLSSKKNDKEVFIFIKSLIDFQQIEKYETGISIGAGMSLGEMKKVLEEFTQEFPEEKTRFFSQIVKALEPIESEQILNAAVSVMYNWQFCLT